VTSLREAERLRQELARCRRQNQALMALCHLIGSRHAALNFRAFQLSRDNQTLQFHVAGLRGHVEYLRRQVEGLRSEVETLRRVIRRCDSETDRCRPFRAAFTHRAPAVEPELEPRSGN
jgi:chromosome segregation ATPase